MLMNSLSHVGNPMRDGDTNHACFYWEKRRRMMWAKNKSTTPSLAFPFALILNKTGSFAEKEDMRFGGCGIKNTC